MKVLFIDDSQDIALPHPQHVMAPLDIGYMASMLDIAGHQYAIIDRRISKKNISGIIKVVNNFMPDIVMIKPGYHSDNFLKTFGKWISGITIICYGTLASLRPHKIIDENISYCIIGEPEAVFDDIINSLESRESLDSIPGICYVGQKDLRQKIVVNKRKPKERLDRLPFPKHELFFDRYQFFYPMKMKRFIRPGFVMSSRGCPQDCAFCSPLERVSVGRKYRIRSPKNVVDELSYMADIGYNTIYFVDDNFMADRDRVIDICTEIIRRRLHKNMKFACQARIDDIDDQVARMMRLASFSTIALGIESGSDKVLERLNKGFSVKDIIDATSILRKNGLWMTAFFMLGSPGETEEDVMSSMKLARIIRPKMLQLHLFKVYQAASFSREYTATYQNPYESDIKVNPSKIPRFRLIQLNREFYRRYYISTKYFSEAFPNVLLHYAINIGQMVPLISKAIGMLFHKHKV